MLVSFCTLPLTITHAAEIQKEIQEEVPNISQHFTGRGKIYQELRRVLPEIAYNVDNLSQTAEAVNTSNWQPNKPLNRNLTTKIQALLNWNHHGVGAVDGYWGKNTRKAMQAFQQSQGLALTDTMNEETWQALLENPILATQPVLVNYALTDADVNIDLVSIPDDTQEKAQLEGLYYETLLEALAEKFHMTQEYLQKLNPEAQFEVGEVLTVYNPGNPNTKAVSRVVADKSIQTLYIYDSEDNLIASYPTTVGSSATPSPSGTHQVKVKVYQPNYTYTHPDGSKSILPPGANNPVGLIWIGLTKPTYGIHGSPDPERISRQASSGCIRLTNWDAKALYAVIDDDAVVEFQD